MDSPFPVSAGGRAAAGRPDAAALPFRAWTTPRGCPGSESPRCFRPHTPSAEFRAPSDGSGRQPPRIPPAAENRPAAAVRQERTQDTAGDLFAETASIGS